MPLRLYENYFEDLAQARLVPVTSLFQGYLAAENKQMQMLSNVNRITKDEYFSFVGGILCQSRRIEQ